MIKPNEKVHWLSLILLLLATAAPMWAQSGATVLATTDLDCNWKLDGKPQGVLKADDAKVVAVSMGKHQVQATSTDGQDEWRTVVNVTQAGQEMLEIKLKAAHEKRAAEADLKQNPTWTDPATGLMWTRQDNGSPMTWWAARDHCRDLNLSGYSSWRLPTIDELVRIYDTTQPEDYAHCHLKGGITLPGYCGGTWSNTEGEGVGPVSGIRYHGYWVFAFFRGGKRNVSSPGAENRVLCVRRSGE